MEIINRHLIMLEHERVGREASPSAAIIDSQSVKTTKLQVHSPGMQDRDGAGPLLRALS